MNKMAPYAHWFLRVALASVFIYHGLNKFPGAEKLSLMLQMPMIAIYIVAAAEAIAGILLLAGGFGKGMSTRIGAGIIAIVMLGAIKIHWGQWSFMPSQTHPLGGIEFQVGLLLCAAYLLIKGNEF
ncbi:MAG: DoxX family protein [Candidatus Omnitrophica bacterium]|nr:DoxX family protein [Candidatus Omnitrophota bacterium]